MLDGFLLFTILDIWRILLPLGLSIMCLGTFVFQNFAGQSQGTGLIQFLCIVTYRLAVALVCILGVVGLVIPWVLGYALPEVHVADGPWSYEEIFGFMLGLVLLWRLQQQVRQQQNPSALIMAAAMILFLGVALIWIARWDVMGNAGAVRGGWFLGSSAQWEWARLIPKSFHLIFSAMVTGGIVVAVLGMLETLTPKPVQEMENSGSMSRSLNLIRYGVGWILSGLVTQMLIGPWLFLLLPSRPQMALIEGASLTSLIFFVSLTTALLGLVLLNASFMAPHVKGLVWGGLGNVGMTLVLMGIIRYEAFGATLFSHGIPFAMAELTGWHVLSVFILLGLCGALLVRWCVWPSTLIFHGIWPTSQLDKS
jgi:hypothetical protein